MQYAQLHLFNYKRRERERVGSRCNTALRHASPSPLRHSSSPVHLRRLLVPLYFSLEHANEHLRPLILTARNNDNNGEPRGSREVFSSMVTSCAARRPPRIAHVTIACVVSHHEDRQCRENADDAFYCPGKVLTDRLRPAKILLF